MSPFNEGSINSGNQGEEVSRLEQEKAKLSKELESLFAEKEKELDVIYQKQMDAVKRKYEERLKKMEILVKIVKPAHREEALKNLQKEFDEEDKNEVRDDGGDEVTAIDEDIKSPDDKLKEKN